MLFTVKVENHRLSGYCGMRWNLTPHPHTHRLLSPSCWATPCPVRSRLLGGPGLPGAMTLQTGLVLSWSAFSSFLQSWLLLFLCLKQNPVFLEAPVLAVRCCEGVSDSYWEKSQWYFSSFLKSFHWAPCMEAISNGLWVQTSQLCFSWNLPCFYLK